MYPLQRKNKLLGLLLQIFLCLGSFSCYAPATQAREVYRGASDRVDIALEDKQGHLWFTDHPNGFVEFDGQAWWLYEVPPIPGDKSSIVYQNIVKDAAQNLYFEVSRQFKSTPSPLGTWVNEYYQLTKNGELSALIQGESSPCFQWDKNPQSQDASVSCVLVGQDSRHRVYLMRSQDKFRANGDTEFGSFEILRQEDKKWVSLIQKYRLARYLEQSPTSNLSCHLNLDKRDRQWFSCSFTRQKTEQRVLFMVDAKEAVHVFPNRAFLYEDPQDGIWAGLEMTPGQGKLSHFTSHGSWENFLAPDAPTDIWEVQADRHGRIWVMARPSGTFALYTRSGSRWQKVWSFNQAIPAFAFDQTNTLWVASGHAVDSFRLAPKSTTVAILSHKVWPWLTSVLPPDFDRDKSYINRIFVDHWNHTWFSFDTQIVELAYYDSERVEPTGFAPIKYDGKNWFYFTHSEPIAPQPDAK